MASVNEQECPISSWRRTEYDDLFEVKKLIKVPQTELLFGYRDIEDLVEKSNMSFCQENSVGRIISCVCLCDHPNIPALSPTVWLDWAKQLYRLRKLTARNTYFIHFLVWSPNYASGFLKLLLHTIFINNYFLQNILLVSPPGAQTVDIFEEYFTRILPFNTRESYETQTVLICKRKRIIPRLRIRKALEEDNDDVIPILESQNEDLRNLYGDFYVAEMIGNPEKNRQMVVAEHAGRAVGFMSMNTNIDFKILNEHFKIEPFYGLKKPAKNDIRTPIEQQRDSLEGLMLPFVIGSEDDISRLKILSSVSEQDPSTLMGPSTMDSPRGPIDRKDSDPAESIISEESLTMYQSYEELNDNEGEVVEDEEEEDEDEGEEEEDDDEEEDEDEEEEETFERGSKIDIEEKISISKYTHLDVPLYCGKPNAFTIELFGMHDQWDERMSIDFLEAAFECYPDLDYCILTLPPTCTNFPLLTHFVRVVPRPSRSFSHELYVCHRNSLFSELTVRQATELDLPKVKSLITLLRNKLDMLTEFEAAVTNATNLAAFVVLSENDVVGVAIVTPEEDVLHLQTHYDIEAYANLKLHTFYSHGVLRYFSVSPIFSCHQRFFMSEILRLSDFTSLYYIHDTKARKKAKTNGCNLVSTLESMIPILPRRQIQYCVDTLENNIPSSSVLRDGSHFALYYMNKRFSTLPKFCVNTRIVIVGASNTCISFLENLLFGSSSTYLTFNNITLVSPHGLPGEYEIDKYSKKLFVYNGYYDASYMVKLNLRSYINIIYGKLTAINKIEKYIVVNHSSLIHYDYLMIFCGKLFHLPSKYAFVENVEKCVHGRRKSIDKSIEDIPQNVFLINTEIDAANSMIALKHFIKKKDHLPIIVYGSCLEAYCCVAALLEFGVKGNNICFVETLDRDYPYITCFNDKDIDGAVMENIRNNNVNVLSGYYFADWTFSKSLQIVTEVKFESKTKTIFVECAAMFYYGNKCISKTAFLAFERGQIVFDGSLVIDHNFRTSDKYIYAAGTSTKYARRYYADSYSHYYYNSKEIGEKVAKKMLVLWDPTQKTTEDNNEILPLFVQPIVKSCILPGKRYYLKVCKPGITVPLEEAMNQDNYGIDLTTGDCKSDSAINYFRIHLNSFNLVETITCYSNEVIDVDSYMSLYGIHERILNNMVTRFETGYITDFYKYFKQPWGYAVLLDRFNGFLNNLVKVFAEKKDTSFSTLLNSIRLYFARTNWKEMNLEKFEEFKIQYKMNYEKDIQDLLIKFISDNANQLPMYAYPEIVNRILQGYSKSPLFLYPDDHDGNE